MILDSSVLLAILQEESGWESLESAIKRAETVLISSATILETATVIRARYGQEHVENMPKKRSRSTVKDNIKKRN